MQFAKSLWVPCASINLHETGQGLTSTLVNEIK